MFNRYDVLSAYYLYGALYHKGQHTREYAYMGGAMKCGFNPGLLFSYDSLSDNGAEIYLSLVFNRDQDRIQRALGF